MTRVGAIDVGTNTVRVLVADRAPDDRLTDIERAITFARLGEGVDETRVLSDAAIDRAVAAVAAYAQRWAAHGCTVTRAIATSAVRDARNRDVFLARVLAETGVHLECISGEEEARLSYLGATVGLEGAPVQVLDIGGGSSEIIIGAADRIDAAVSLDIGAVRLTERHVTHDPPTPDEIEAMRFDVRMAMDAAPAPRADARFVGVAGTVTTLAVLALGLDGFDATQVHHALLTREVVEDLLVTLSQMTAAQRRDLPSMPGREDVIVAGAVILAEVMDHLRVPLCVVSVSDILDGTAISAGAQE
jgi:exopolyphosphatase / guanosine-5'-triphosphate,3'-diphosphate pyrophosphatase